MGTSEQVATDVNTPLMFLTYAQVMTNPSIPPDASNPVLAAVDVGSNSIKMTVARSDGAGGLLVLDAASETVRLGTGVASTGMLAEDRVAAALATLTDFANRARTHGASQLIGVATEATRSASNGPAFLDQVREIGWEIAAISGDDEAALTFRGLALEVDLSGWVVAVDIGGGSTEVIIAQDREIVFSRSFVLGSGTLTEQFVTTDPPANDDLATCTLHAITTLADVKPPASERIRLVATGGTGEYLGRLVPDAEHISPAEIDQARAVCTETTAADLAERIGIPEARARVLPAGIAIVQAVVARVQPSAIEVAQSGIRTGMLLAALEKASEGTR
jgi:exopolyphosphatase/guanosine-5'-triphosphate,3'-diphosphate pyrophosphatase